MNKIFKVIFESLPFPMWVRDLEFKYIFVNDRYTKMLNKSKEKLLMEESDDIYILHCQDVLDSSEARLVSVNIDGILKHCFIFPIVNDNKDLVAIAGMFIEENPEKEKNLAEKIMDILPGVIFYKDIDSKYVYANKDCRDFYEQKGIDNILGKTDVEINENIKLAQKFLEDDKKVIESKSAIYNEAVFEDESGEKQYKEVVKIPLIDSEGNVSGIVGRSMDVTDKRVAQEKLRYLSYTDVLTEVGNRACFEARLTELSKEDFLPLGIIMGDTNGLKEVNDSFGHQEGDNLLRETANILKYVCNNIGEVFRIGGDEFVILLPNTNKEKCEEIIKLINDKCEAYDNEIFNISIALGSSVRESKDNNILNLLKEADDKVYKQKLSNKKSLKKGIVNSKYNKTLSN